MFDAQVGLDRGGGNSPATGTRSSDRYTLSLNCASREPGTSGRGFWCQSFIYQECYDKSTPFTTPPAG